MRDDLPLPNSSNAAALNVRNSKKKLTGNSGKMKYWNTWFVAYFFSVEHIFLILGTKMVMLVEQKAFSRDFKSTGNQC